MRHRKTFNHLGRTASHRKAMLSNMASQLIMHKRINTTLAKAKALRSFVEPLITKSKEDSTHSRRMVFSYLQNKEAINELFREVSTKVIDRPGGYTRILKTGFRKGDGAEMCFIELVDYNENMLATQEEETQKRTRRSRRGGKKKTEPQAVAQDVKAQESAEDAEKQETKSDKHEDIADSKTTQAEQPEKDTAVAKDAAEKPVEKQKEPVKEAEPKAEKAEKEEQKPDTKAEAKEKTKTKPEAKDEEKTQKPAAKKDDELKAEKDTKVEKKEKPEKKEDEKSNDSEENKDN